MIRARVPRTRADMGRMKNNTSSRVRTANDAILKKIWNLPFLILTGLWNIGFHIKTKFPRDVDGGLEVGERKIDVFKIGRFENVPAQLQNRNTGCRFPGRFHLARLRVDFESIN